MRRAIQYPIRIIAHNAGAEASIVVGKLLEQKSNTFGFDAQNEKYVDFIDAGIVDPTKVVRVALQDAASVAGLLITTEAMITDRPKKDDGPSLPGGGGMGGMGGMDFEVQNSVAIKYERPGVSTGPFRIQRQFRSGLSRNAKQRSSYTSAGRRLLSKLSHGHCEARHGDGYSGCRWRPTMSESNSFYRQLQGYSLATASILYRMPDHPAILQTYIGKNTTGAAIPRTAQISRFLDEIAGRTVAQYYGGACFAFQTR